MSLQPAAERVLLLLVLGIAACAEERPTAPVSADPAEGAPHAGDGASGRGANGFIRHVSPEGSADVRLETAICVYQDAEGRRVDLVGAIHIGDQDYFDTLDALFRGYDALLYEMVKPADASPVRAPGEAESLISLAQRMMKDVLDLQFQLDAVDYSAENFVHADLEPESFARKQAEQGESLLTLLLNSAFTQMAKDQANPEEGMVAQMTLFLALLSKDRSSALKRVLAGQFLELEALATGIGGENGSVLLEGRNERAFEVLEEQLDAGHRKLGVFYGAAHLPDMEQRLLERGFEFQRQAWVTAWDVPGPEGRDDAD